jgi:hypothetical protein
MFPQNCAAVSKSEMKIFLYTKCFDRFWFATSDLYTSSKRHPLFSDFVIYNIVSYNVLFNVGSRFFSTRNWFRAFSLNILVTRVLCPLRFSVENRYNKKIYIKTTLPKPYDVITFNPKQKITVYVNSTSTTVVEVKAYDFLQNTELLPINGQFSIQLTPGATSLIPLAVPSADYSK